jgi:FdhD protein
MVQKAWAAGFTALVAVSAPSALAVATARRAGLTLAAFVRNGTANLYSPDRLV